MSDPALIDALNNIGVQLGRISTGGSEPTGLEALVMAISAGGINNHESLAQELSDAIQTAASCQAKATESLTSTLEELGQDLSNSQLEAATTVKEGLLEVANSIRELAAALPKPQT